MFRKISTTFLIFIYALTIPTLLVTHVHPLGIGTGKQLICQGEEENTRSSSASSQPVTCQICSRLSSTDLLRIESEVVRIESYSLITQFFDVPVFSHLSHDSVQLRAPPSISLA